MLSSWLCSSQFLLLILYRLCLTTKTSKHILHSQFTPSSTQNYAIHTTQCTAQRHRSTTPQEKTDYGICYNMQLLHVTLQTHIHTILMTATVTLWVLLLILVNSERHWNCTAHFRYRGSIKYRDTRHGIVIVAPISGIIQHYVAVLLYPSHCDHSLCVFEQINQSINQSIKTLIQVDKAQRDRVKWLHI